MLCIRQQSKNAKDEYVDCLCQSLCSIPPPSLLSLPLLSSFPTGDLHSPLTWKMATLNFLQKEAGSGGRSQPQWIDKSKTTSFRTPIFLYAPTWVGEGTKPCDRTLFSLSGVGSVCVLSLSLPVTLSLFNAAPPPHTQLL